MAQHLRIIKINELNSFVASDFFQQLGNIPISPLRAMSQSVNPNAHPEDPVLIIATEENELLAYAGVLPEKIQHSSKTKVAWNSCWWGHPQKGRGATMKVLYKALQLWDKQLLFDELPQRSKQVLELVGGFLFKDYPGAHCFLRFKFKKIVARKYPSKGFLDPVLGILDACLNGLNNLRLRSSVSNGVRVEEIKALDQESAEFIFSHQSKELVGRSLESMRWVLEKPWLANDQSNQADLKKRYHFSSYAEKFEHNILKVYQTGNLIALLWISLRDGTAKTPYVFIDDGYDEIAFIALLNFLVEKNADTLITFQPDLVKMIKMNGSKFLKVKPISKTFGFPDGMKNLIEQYPVVQDGDGDVVFT